MNWRATAPILKERYGASKGMRIVAAMLRDGTMPAIDFIENVLSEKDRRAMAERLHALATEGSAAVPTTMFRFLDKGIQKEEDMGEFSFRGQMGDRVLSFRRVLAGVPSLILTNGFTKPNQKGTPERAFGQARLIFREFWELTKSGTQVPQVPCS